MKEHTKKTIEILGKKIKLYENQNSVRNAREALLLNINTKSTTKLKYSFENEIMATEIENAITLLKLEKSPGRV